MNNLNPIQVVIQNLQNLDNFLGRLELNRVEHNGINQLFGQLHDSIMKLVQGPPQAQAPGRFEKELKKPESKIPKGTGK